MATPTLSVAAVQLRLTDPSPPVAVRLVGAVGGVVSALPPTAVFMSVWISDWLSGRL